MLIHRPYAEVFAYIFVYVFRQGTKYFKKSSVEYYLYSTQ